MIVESKLTLEFMLFTYRTGLNCAWYPLLEKHEKMPKVRTSVWATC